MIFPPPYPRKPFAYDRSYYSYLNAGGKDPIKRESEDASATQDNEKIKAPENS